MGEGGRRRGSDSLVCTWASAPVCRAASVFTPTGQGQRKLAKMSAGHVLCTRVRRLVRKRSVTLRNVQGAFEVTAIGEK